MVIRVKMKFRVAAQAGKEQHPDNRSEPGCLGNRFHPEDQVHGNFACHSHLEPASQPAGKWFSGILTRSSRLNLWPHLRSRTDFRLVCKTFSNLRGWEKLGVAHLAGEHNTHPATRSTDGGAAHRTIAAVTELCAEAYRQSGTGRRREVPRSIATLGLYIDASVMRKQHLRHLLAAIPCRYMQGPSFVN